MIDTSFFVSETETLVASHIHAEAKRVSLLPFECDEEVGLRRLKENA
jgi:hypothetical protein